MNTCRFTGVCGPQGMRIVCIFSGFISCRRNKPTARSQRQWLKSFGSNGQLNISTRECSKAQATKFMLVALVAGLGLAFLFLCGAPCCACRPWSRGLSLFPREGVECYMSGNCKSERLFLFVVLLQLLRRSASDKNFVDLPLIDADATGSARRADAAANFGEIWMDQCKWIHCC